MGLRYHVDGVPGDLDDQILGTHDRLTTQTGLRLKPPGLIQQILLCLLGRRQRVEALPQDDVTGRAGARLLAGVRQIDAMRQGRIANGGSRLDLEHGTLWADLDVGQKDEFGHGIGKPVVVLYKALNKPILAASAPGASCPATESRISDKDFDYVINTVIFDSFRKNQFYDGIINALDYLNKKIKQ